MLIVAVDPGLSGAIAFLDTRAQRIEVHDMPAHAVGKTREVDAYQLARLIDAQSMFIDHGVIELVHSMPKQGVASSFKFGKAAGMAEMALAAYFIPITRVTPQVWKRDLRLPKGKDAARAMASQIFPNQCELFARAKDDGRAEATLIAMWHWNKNRDA